MDDAKRRARKAVKAAQRAATRAALPLAPTELRHLFDRLDERLGPEPCDHTLRMTHEWLDERGHDRAGVVPWLHENGGFCDCEVLNIEEILDDAAPRRSATIEIADLSHVHARLTIVINGRELPRLGVFGPDDVRLNRWVEELRAIQTALAAPDGRYVFDEGEAGPAFVFERSGGRVFVSVDGEPAWTRVPCATHDFLAAVDGALVQIRSAYGSGNRG